MNELVRERGCCRGLGDLPCLGVHICVVPPKCSGKFVPDSLWGRRSTGRDPPRSSAGLPGFQMPARSSGLYTRLTLSTLPTLRTPPFLLSGSPRGPLPMFMKTEHVIQTGTSGLAQLRIRSHYFYLSFLSLDFTSKGRPPPWRFPEPRRQ